MEKIIKEVVYSSTFYDDLKAVYLFGYEIFGSMMADLFQEKILHLTYGLSYQFHIYPECKDLATKSQIYRNILLGKYLIVYRIKAKKIEVLKIFHGNQNPVKINAMKKIRPK